jgi:glycosyltransferase involved in cell wall biosynthesis
MRKARQESRVTGADLERLPPPPPAKTGWPWTEAGPRPPASLPGGQPWPRLSIVTPSFNHAEFLEETIRSVLLQGYPGLEYILVDGGSTDGSLEIIRRYAPWLTRWVSEPDSGQAEAVNKGLGWASGEIFGWLNSDDIYAPGALAAAAGAFAAHPKAILVYGGAHQVDRDGGLIGPAPQVRPYDRRYLLEESDPIAQPAAFFRAQAWQAAGGLDASFHYVMDYELWLRFDRLGPAVHLARVLASMRLYPEAKTYSGGRRIYLELRRMVERHGGRGLPAYFEDLLRRTHLTAAFEAYRQGDTAQALDELAFVLDVLPHWQEDGRLLADEIVSRAWSLPESAGDDCAPIEFAERVCRHLPPGVAAPAQVRRRALGLLYQALALRSYSQGRPRAARRHAWRAVTHDAERLGNRGLWSVAVRSWLGPAVRQSSGSRRALKNGTKA